MSTQEEKVKAIEQQRLDRILELLDKESGEDIRGNADRALWHALTLWKDDLPKVDAYFHKCFRQCDVTDNGHSDMIIWHLLVHSNRFWRIVEKVLNELPDAEETPQQ